MQMPAFLARFTMKEQVVEREPVHQVTAAPEETTHSHDLPTIGARLIASAKGNHYKKPVSL